MVYSKKRCGKNIEACRRSILEKTVKKFYGMVFLVWACNKNPLEKPVQYVLLIESNSEMDNVLKKRFILKVMRQLSFKYNTWSKICRKIVDEFCLVDLKEWEENGNRNYWCHIGFSSN